MYNEWFIEFAPKTYNETRIETTKQVEAAFELTENLSNITSAMLRDNPATLPILRMATAPPIARDRLIGLAQVSPNLVKRMEIDNNIPLRMGATQLEAELVKITKLLDRLTDRYVLPWLQSGKTPSNAERRRAATIIADRLCGTVADPVIRNAQEERQFSVISQWLDDKGYSIVSTSEVASPEQMKPGTYAYHLNIKAQLGDGSPVNIPIDVAIKPASSHGVGLPLLVEAKSAGDFANVNKRRKEEADKVSNLKRTYSGDLRYILFLGGYFDPGYLGYEAAEGIDWVWEHRTDDFAALGL